MEFSECVSRLLNSKTNIDESEYDREIDYCLQYIANIENIFDKRIENDVKLLNAGIERIVTISPRLATIRLSSFMRSEGSVKSLIDISRRSRDPIVIESVIFALGNIRSQAALPYLYECLKGNINIDKEAVVAKAGAVVSKMSRDPVLKSENNEFLVDCAHPDWFLRLSAAISISLIFQASEDVEIIKPVIHFVESCKKEVILMRELSGRLDVVLRDATLVHKSGVHGVEYFEYLKTDIFKSRYNTIDRASVIVDCDKLYIRESIVRRMFYLRTQQSIDYIVKIVERDSASDGDWLHVFALMFQEAAKTDYGYFDLNGTPRSDKSDRAIAIASMISSWRKYGLSCFVAINRYYSHPILNHYETLNTYYSDK